MMEALCHDTRATTLVLQCCALPMAHLAKPQLKILTSVSITITWGSLSWDTLSWGSLSWGYACSFIYIMWVLYFTSWSVMYFYVFSIDYLSSFAIQDTMATLQLMSIFVILVVCWSVQHVDGQGLCLCVQGSYNMYICAHTMYIYYTNQSHKIWHKE